jgi:tRNA (guanosine-2'-O-)-methyltransferase
MDYNLPPKSALLAYYKEFITRERWQRFNDVIRNRTRYITVVLEDIFQPHNASAVLRTCDCFGIQDVHIIENDNDYEINPDVALGSDKWLSIHKYNSSGYNTPQCYNHLRSKGYRIVATTPHKHGSELGELDLHTGKIALIFGTEYEGLTENAIEDADEYVRIPMYGFTESFNISVTAALSLYDLTGRLRNSELDWTLSEGEALEVRLDWCRRSVKKWQLLESDFLKNYKTGD